MLVFPLKGEKKEGGLEGTISFIQASDFRLFKPVLASLMKQWLLRASEIQFKWIY